MGPDLLQVSDSWAGRAESVTAPARFSLELPVRHHQGARDRADRRWSPARLDERDPVRSACGGWPAELDLIVLSEADGAGSEEPGISARTRCPQQGQGCRPLAPGVLLKVRLEHHAFAARCPLPAARCPPTSPQPVRRTPVDPRRRPTHANARLPGQGLERPSVAGQVRAGYVPLQRVADRAALAGPRRVRTYA